ncbi:MAG: helix-turn-helix transcriptional regulator [Calditrichia bacterium]
MDLSVARRIREIMKEKKLTQQDLSGLLGVSQPAVSQYLRGRIPPADILLRLAQLAGSSIEFLLTGAPSPAEDKLVREAAPPYGNRQILLELWEQLSPAIQKDLLSLMRHVAEMQKSLNAAQ